MNDAHTVDDAGGPANWARVLFFAVVFIAAALWISTSDGDEAAFARSFLRNLFRQLF